MSRVKYKKSIFSSKTKNYLSEKRLKKSFKRKYKNLNRYHILKASNSRYAKVQLKKISFVGDIVFPEKLNLIKSISNDIRTAKQENKKISIDHRKMDYADNASILLLTAEFYDILKDKLIRRQKLSPKNKNMAYKLEQIGYWEALCGNVEKTERSPKYLKIKHNDNWEKTINDFHCDVIAEFENVYDNFGMDDKNKDQLKDAIFEALANAAEHAFVGQDRNEHRRIWLMGEYDEKNKELEFIFYDSGIGIFESINYGESKFKKFLNNFKLKAGEKNLLKMLCTKDLSRYKDDSGKTNRGLGMMAFKKFIDNLKISTIISHSVLTVVSNKYMYSTEIGNRELQSTIKGTLIMWKITKKD